MMSIISLRRAGAEALRSITRRERTQVQAAIDAVTTPSMRRVIRSSLGYRYALLMESLRDLG
jgi:hypothetical protein